MTQIITLAEIIIPGTNRTRDPTPLEMISIAAYIERFTQQVGKPPICDHTVEGVGEVLFSRDPSTPIPLAP